MMQGKNILFFGGSDWWYHNPSSGIQLLREMVASGNQALYVNSVPLRMPKPGKSGSWCRYRNKFKSYAKFLKQAEDNIWVLTPITIPGFGHQQIQYINERLLLWQIRFAMRTIGWKGKKPVVISSTPAAALVLPVLKSKVRVIVYYLCDKFDKFRDIAGSNLISPMDSMMVSTADLLVCVSKEIQAAYINDNPRCYYVPHGSNFELFHTAVTDELPLPEDMRDIRKPVIGYFGSVTESNDKDILEAILKKHPEWNVVLIGQVVSDYSRLEQYPNMHFLGKKELGEIPAYGKHFDVCIMNWVMNEWMQYCNPVKAKEYLAMGKPVVSVPIPEVVNTMGDVVAIAATPDEFVDKLEQELANNSPERERQRVEKVRGDTWYFRADEISGLIESFIGGGR
ncbi:glycosyltransferase [Thiorhodovibrio frisius]|uniref:Glycosyltransferase n=1 Tax=Thiorhodovibrio frisius TaxID=631362 RepID=H8YYD4_9GAMM|nr:glycosyltransferase [Thiorhodovibrio frisius]EIC23460.1 hypothetical protein Thi970DRAFT_01128 [Thiorhodovibrio frisius]WPL23457.1 Putative teichuronic acid biosynthesis glycosyltransferase TuaH [Thiorhodovibrio frisius]